MLYGVAAFARGDYREEVRWLEPVADQVVRLRGSHAQREVFADTLLAAYLQAGEYAKAEAALRRRLARRPSARDAFWLGRALLGLGQVAEARVSLQDARARWAEAEPEGSEPRALRAALRLVTQQERRGEGG